MKQLACGACDEKLDENATMHICVLGYDTPAATDPITSPAHYTALSPEPLDVILAWNLSFPEGCIVKYVARWRRKGGVDDLRKARVYLDRLIAQAEAPKP